MAESAPRDRLALAVEALAVSAEPIQQRLADAGLHLITASPEEFSDLKRREQFVAVTEALTRTAPAGDEGALDATTARLRNDEAVELARQIVGLDVACRPLA